jgi:tRNA A37 threonylcarbamoyladenosine biosynthesis protein TsaE
VVLIEWPEQAKRFLPKNTVLLQFNYGKKENERTIVITRPAGSAAPRALRVQRKKKRVQKIT